MATTKKEPAQNLEIDDNHIIKLYMNDVLDNNHNTKNVYVFCKNNNIEEPQFYSFFGSLEAIKQSIWAKLLDNAIDSLSKDENYVGYPDKNKLLSLYFTLFEILTLNRSYIIYSLHENKEGMKNLKDFKSFRTNFKEFVNDMIQENESSGRLSNVTRPLFSEGAWIQFLFILKFWTDDNSKSFEKTDILIEKSVNTIVDLLDTKRVDNLLDFGKFLWKEKMM